jgi:molybdenum cofactor synthesis domain-containing protein
VRERLEAHFGESHWHVELASEILPDDAGKIRAALEASRDRGGDVVITTGGTGVGPRDVTPDVVLAMADKTVPGIMEHIRTLYGAEKPAALLSRGVAAVAGRMLIYTLPGSRKAVDEYMNEILKTLDHLLFMLNGIDRHH